MKALLTNYRQSPRKVRLVADMIRGKSVAEAKAALSFGHQKSTDAIEKLLDSAVANASQAGASTDKLFVKTITVDKGLVMRRFSPKARGRAGSIRKTSSIIRIELGDKGAPAVGAAPKKAAKTAETKKPAPKKAAPRAKKAATK